MNKIILTYSNVRNKSFIRPLSEKIKLNAFYGSLIEYNDHLLKDALRFIRKTVLCQMLNFLIKIVRLSV